MDPMDSMNELQRKKKRIPKACASCRRSKVKCDGKRPCTRCSVSRFECVFIEAAKDPVTERFENLENTIYHMGQQIETMIHQQSSVAQMGPSPSAHPRDHPASPQRTERSVPAPSPCLQNLTFAPVHVLSPDLSSPNSSTIIQPQGVPVMDSFGNVAFTPDAVSPQKQWQDFALSKNASLDVVSRGLVGEGEAEAWFGCFFDGCDRFVPVFSPEHDKYHSVRACSGLLFDTIVTYGCRAANGPSSQAFQMLQSILRERVCDLMQTDPISSPDGLEVVQALLVLASYSDKGWLLNSIALRHATALNLPSYMGLLLDAVMREKATRTIDVDGTGRLFRMARTWCGLFNLEQILSLDGGKAPTITFKTSPRRLRMLCTHPCRNAIDLRLFPQVELNVIRASSYASLSSASQTSSIEDMASNVASIVRGAVIDLDLWLEEWNVLIASQVDNVLESELSTTLLSLQIQHAWALITLHLRALSTTGIENIAAMTESQCALVLAAKEASVRHFELLLTNTQPLDDNEPVHGYLEGLRYAMDFVWAKLAFSVLLVLRLGMLLNDPIELLLSRTGRAKDLLAELEKAGGAEVSYSRILAVSVEKCERALKESQEAQRQDAATDIDGATSATMRSAGGDSAAEKDFQTYVPKEFLFEWAFPGLNLCYVPLDWQDLFVDFGAVF